MPATPPYHAPVANSHVQASDVGQFLGTHSAMLIYQGQEYIAETGTTLGHIGSNTGSAPQWVAVQAKLSNSAPLGISRIELYLASAGTGADITVELRPDNGGVPANYAAWSITVPREFMTPGTQVISIPVNVLNASVDIPGEPPTGGSLQFGAAGTFNFWIVIDGTADTANYCEVGTNTAYTNAFTSADGLTGWTSQGANINVQFAVYYGVNGVLRNTYEDYGARWTAIDYTNSGRDGNTTPTVIREYTGAFRSVRTLGFTNGQLTSVA